MPAHFEVLEKGEAAFTALSEEAKAVVDTQPYLYGTLRRQYDELKRIYIAEFLSETRPPAGSKYYHLSFVCNCQGECRTCKTRKMIDTSGPRKQEKGPEPAEMVLQVPYAERTINSYLQAYLVAALEFLWHVLMQPSRIKVKGSLRKGWLLDADFLCRNCKYNLEWVAFREEVGKVVFHFRNGRELSSWEFD